MGDIGEDEPDDSSSQPSLEEALAKLGLTSLTETFQREQIDFDSLVSTKMHCPSHCVCHKGYTLYFCSISLSDLIDKTLANFFLCVYSFFTVTFYRLRRHNLIYGPKFWYFQNVLFVLLVYMPI